MKNYNFKKGFIAWIISTALSFTIYDVYFKDEDVEGLLFNIRQLQDTVENDPALESSETDEVLTTEQREVQDFMEKQKEKFFIDDELGPLIYKPYAGGNKFPVMETLNVKPGFKIWVDGGIKDYNDETCIAKQLDCRSTCCMQSYCAPHMGLCLNYKRRSYSEIYIGIMVITMIVVGIPTCIMTLEFVLNFKFCQQYDEEKDAMLGGMTICEACTWVMTCGKSMKAPEPEMDEFLIKYEQKQAEKEAKTEVQDLEQNFKDTAAQQAPKPTTYKKQDTKKTPQAEEIPMDEDNIFYQDGMVVDGVLPTGRRGNSRNCCTRIICLIFCCDTNDIGAQSHLNALNEQEIQIYQAQLKAEYDRREKDKQALLAKEMGDDDDEDGDMGGAIPQPEDKKSEKTNAEN